ncbi:MAG: hexitol phosphatase HxpB [Flavobacterium sp.]
MKRILSNKKAVIFDMDGVIVDSEKFWAKSEYDVFTSLGVKGMDEFSNQTKFMTTKEVAEFWYGKHPWNNTSISDVEQMVIDKVIELITTEDCAISGIKEFIQNLRNANFKIGLATNSPSRIIPKVLEKTKMLHLFDAVASADFEVQGKPHPGVYFSIAGKLKVSPSDCVAIEDSTNGMLSAHSAGMSVIAFTNGNKNLSFEIADYTLHSFENIL